MSRRCRIESANYPSITSNFGNDIRNLPPISMSMQGLKESNCEYPWNYDLKFQNVYNSPYWNTDFDEASNDEHRIIKSHLMIDLDTINGTSSSSSQNSSEKDKDLKLASKSDSNNICEIKLNEKLDNKNIGKKIEIDFFNSVDLLHQLEWESEWMQEKNKGQLKEYVKKYIIKPQQMKKKKPKFDDKKSFFKICDVKKEFGSRFLTGLLFGVLIVQSLILALVVKDKMELLKSIYTISNKQFLHTVTLMRSFLLISIFLLLVTINIWICRLYGINHVLIFELDSRHHLRIEDLIKIFLVLSNISISFGLGFVYNYPYNQHLWIWPFGVLVGYTIWLLNPLKFGYRESRIWLLRKLIRIFATPFCRVTFAEFWLADQLNSIKFVLIDLIIACHYFIEKMIIEYFTTDNSAVTFSNYRGNNANLSIEASSNSDKSQYLSSPLIIYVCVSVIVIWFRLGQCLRRFIDVRQIFPHMVNCGKYASSILQVLVTILSEYYWPQCSCQLFVTVLVKSFNTIYTFLWDIFMDWKLLIWKDGSGLSMKRRFIFGKCWYLLAVIINLVLRVAWISGVIWGSSYTYLGFCLSVGEMFRRFVWNFLRFESEYLNNCGHFVATKN